MEGPDATQAYAQALCRTIPRAIVDAALAEPTPPELLSTRFDGVVLHIDVVGFTTISEQLAARGDVGLAQLTRGVDLLLRDLLEQALLPAGGDAVQFGGDSATVVFRGDRAAHRAAHAAMVAQRILPGAIDRHRRRRGPLRRRPDRRGALALPHRGTHRPAAAA